MYLHFCKCYFIKPHGQISGGLLFRDDGFLIEIKWEFLSRRVLWIIDDSLAVESRVCQKDQRKVIFQRIRCIWKDIRVPVPHFVKFQPYLSTYFFNLEEKSLQLKIQKVKFFQKTITRIVKVRNFVFSGSIECWEHESRVFSFPGVPKIYKMAIISSHWYPFRNLRDVKIYQKRWAGEREEGRRDDVMSIWKKISFRLSEAL